MFQAMLFMQLLWFKKQLLSDLFWGNRRNLMKENIRVLYKNKGVFLLLSMSSKSCTNHFSRSEVERFYYLVLLTCAGSFLAQFS